jgi:hypothetical protein
VANRSGRDVDAIILTAFRSHPDRWMTSSDVRRLTQLCTRQVRDLGRRLSNLAEAGRLEKRSTGSQAGGYPTFQYRLRRR